MPVNYTIVKGKKIGRNDPCPCGSGKNVFNALKRLGYKNVELIDVDENIAQSLINKKIVSNEKFNRKTKKHDPWSDSR